MPGRSLRTALLTLVLTLGAANAASAQDWPGLEKVPAVQKTGSADAAVIIAVEDYAFLPDVPGAGRNAADWERFLKDGLGVPTVLTLTNSQAVKEEMLTFAERAAGEVGEGGTLWFVFIGHGGPSTTGDGLLIGADGQQNAKSIAARGVPQSDLLEKLQTGKQARTVVLIDACFSGRDSSGGALAKGTMPVVPVNPVPKETSQLVLMTAAKADEFAGDLPSAERPAFSYLVLGGLRGWADDGDGNVTAEEAVSFARRELLGISGRQQTPQVVGESNFVLSAGAAEARPSSQTAIVTQPPTTGGGADTGVVATTEPPFVADDIPDNPFYGSAHIGYGAREDFGDSGIYALATAGVKFNALTGGKNEWRLGVRFNFTSAENDGIPGDGASVDNKTTGDRTTYEASSDGIRNANTPTFFIGPQFGRAWRWETRPGLWGDTVFEMDLAAGYAVQSDHCSSTDQWKIEADGSGRTLFCDEPENLKTFGAALGVAFQFGLIELGTQVGWAPDIGLMTFFSGGVTYDL